MINIQRLTKFTTLVGAAVLALGVSANTASATTITLMPGDELFTIDQTSNCNATCLSGLLGITVTEDYKSNAGGGEEGSFAGNYETSYTAGNEDATITYTGPEPGVAGTDYFDCGECFLLVKDGNNDPNQYVFDLEAFNWDGKMDIEMLGLWPEGGSISHVSIFYGEPGGGNPGGEPVPEPGTMFLMGSGLAGLGFWRWKKGTKAQA